MAVEEAARLGGAREESGKLNHTRMHAGLGSLVRLPFSPKLRALSVLVSQLIAVCVYVMDRQCWVWSHTQSV
jgi:hypothetical protein